jgi:hypothetical protein
MRPANRSGNRSSTLPKGAPAPVAHFTHVAMTNYEQVAGCNRRSLLAAGRIAGRATEALRTGIGWHEHDHGVFHGVARFYRARHVANLVQSWAQCVWRAWAAHYRPTLLCDRQMPTPRFPCMRLGTSPLGSPRRLRHAQENDMKTFAASVAIALLVFSTATHASPEEDVRARDDQERIAALKRDVSSLEQLWSDEFTVNAPNNRVVVGKKAVLDAFIHSGIINFSSFERDIEFLKVDDDFGIVMGSETLVPAASAASAGLTAGQKVVRRFTNIWKKESGVWRLYWRHANVVPSS